MRDEPQPDTPWIEPWQPSVGQRVRCVPSPECRYRGRADSIAARNAVGPGHHPEESGRTGRVLDPQVVQARMPTWPEEPSHRFMVLWDRPFSAPNGEVANCSSYAAIELEPIGAHADPFPIL